MKSPRKIVLNPNRDNIKFAVLKLREDEKDPKICFRWLLDIIREQGANTTKHLIYCRTIKDAQRVWNTLHRELDSDAYWPKGAARTTKNRLIEMFHSTTLQYIKDYVLSTIQEKSSHLRIIIATNALGMELNFIGVSNLEFYEALSTMDTMMQQMGRIGICRSQSFITVQYHSHQLQGVDVVVKALVKSQKCLILVPPRNPP